MAPIPERGPKGLILACLLLAFFIINEISFRTNLFNYSVTIIGEFQETLPQSVWQYIFQYVFAFAGDPNVIGPLFLIYFFFQVNKFFAVKLLIYNAAGNYLLSILQLFYSNPRPYWVNSNIIPMENYGDYGNPSAHAFMSTFLYGYIFMIVSAEDADIKVRHKKIRRVDSEDQDSPTKVHMMEETKDESKGLRIKLAFIKIFGIIWFCGLLVSRIYMGMDAINQVALGVVYGAFSCYLLTYFIDKRVDKFLLRIITKELNNKQLILWSLGMLYAIFSLVPIVVYISCDINNPLNESITWTQYWLVVQTQLKLPPSSFAYIRCLIECSLIGSLFGIIIGILMTNGEFYDIKVSSFLLGKKLVLRVIIGILMYTFGAGIFSILPIQTTQYIMLYLIQNLGLFSGSFLLIKALPILYSKFDLDCHGDFLRMSKI